MPHKQTERMIVAKTPTETKLFQLISAKMAIILESKGLRHSKFRCGVRGLWAKHYGLPRRATHLQVIQRIQQDIDLLTADTQQELPL